MAFLIGAVLAISVGLAMTIVGMDRDRALYPTVMIVIASYYALFATMGASTPVLLVELIAILVFCGASVAGFRSAWLLSRSKVPACANPRRR